MTDGNSEPHLGTVGQALDHLLDAKARAPSIASIRLRLAGPLLWANTATATHLIASFPARLYPAIANELDARTATTGDGTFAFQLSLAEQQALLAPLHQIWGRLGGQKPPDQNDQFPRW